MTTHRVGKIPSCILRFTWGCINTTRRHFSVFFKTLCCAYYLFFERCPTTLSQVQKQAFFSTFYLYGILRCLTLNTQSLSRNLKSLKLLFCLGFSLVSFTLWLFPKLIEIFFAQSFVSPSTFRCSS